MTNTDTDYPVGRKVALEVGSKRYHGKPCKVCNETLKRTQQSDCVSCHASRNERLNATEESRLSRKVHKRLEKEGNPKLLPKWADKDAMKEIYKASRASGLHVDHIIPINHPLVCGLHVENNLQLLTPQENREKWNTFDPWPFEA